MHCKGSGCRRASVCMHFGQECDAIELTDVISMGFVAVDTAVKQTIIELDEGSDEDLQPYYSDEDYALMLGHR